MTTKQSKSNSPTDITKILSSHDSPHSSKDSSAFLRVCAYCRVSTDVFPLMIIHGSAEIITDLIHESLHGLSPVIIWFSFWS